jgi:hypothetical protein
MSMPRGRRASYSDPNDAKLTLDSYEGGTVVVLNPPIAKGNVSVEVKIDVRVKGDIRPTKGITIALKGGTDPDIIQICSRRYSTIGGWQAVPHQGSHSNDPRDMSYSTSFEGVWWCDRPYTINDPSYVGDGQGRVKGIDTQGIDTLQIFDAPSFSSKTPVQDTSTAVYFEAYTYCICNGGIVGIVNWSRYKKLNGNAAVMTYEAVSVGPNVLNKVIQLGREVLRKEGLDFSRIPLNTI